MIPLHSHGSARFLSWKNAGIHLGRYIDLHFIFNQRKYKAVSLIEEKLIKKNRKWYNRNAQKSRRVLPIEKLGRQLNMNPR